MSTATSIARPLPGAGILARSGDLLLLCADSARTGEVLDLFHEVAAASSDGGVLVRRVAALLANDFDGSLPACAVAGPAADGRLAVLVYGSATAEVEAADGHTVLTGTDAVTSVNRLVNGPIATLRLLLPGAGPSDPRTRLDAGVVMAGGVAVESNEAVEHVRQSTASTEDGLAARWSSVAAVEESSSSGPVSIAEPVVPEPIAPAEPVASVEPVAPAGPEVAAGLGAVEAPAAGIPVADIPAAEAPAVEAPAVAVGAIEVPMQAAPAVEVPAEAPAMGNEEAPLESVALTPAAGLAADLPMRTPAVDERDQVLGVRCDNSHFNDPRRTDCTVCGQPLPTAESAVQPGPRPSLGVLVLDDGNVFGLETDYVLGREPHNDPEVAGGGARPLRVADPDGIVSRRHVRVALNGWDVEVVDLGSANGTTVEVPGEPEPRSIVPHQPVVIVPGTRVNMGRRWFRYEALGRP